MASPLYSSILKISEFSNYKLIEAIRNVYSSTNCSALHFDILILFHLVQNYFPVYVNGNLLLIISLIYLWKLTLNYNP